MQIKTTKRYIVQVPGHKAHCVGGNVAKRWCSQYCAAILRLADHSDLTMSRKRRKAFEAILTEE
jgi:hypothetical protein